MIGGMHSEIKINRCGSILNRVDSGQRDMKKVLVMIAALMLITSCGDSKEGNNGGSSAEIGDISFAYYNKDSIPGNFTYFIDAQSKLEDKAKVYEEKLMKLQQEGQILLDSYQRQNAAGLLSANQAKGFEQQISMKQQQIQVLQETDGMALERESNEGNEELIKKLETYGKNYAKNHGITVFLARETAGQILYMDSTMDVTMDFIKYMNEQESSAKGND